MRRKCSFLSSPETGDLYYVYNGWSYNGVSGKVYNINNDYYYVKSVVYDTPEDCIDIHQNTFDYCCKSRNRIYCRNTRMFDSSRNRVYYYKLLRVPCQAQARDEMDRLNAMLKEKIANLVNA